MTASAVFFKGDRIMSLVKHYIHTMQGIPQLSNTWGSMVALLDAILVTGFNFIPATSIVRSNDQATIRFALNHGFLERQVIRITGSTNGWNGDYKVFSVTSDTVTILCDEALPLSVEGTVICSAAPLDFEIVFKTVDGSPTPKRAYRSTAQDSLGLMLLVHDFASTGASATGAKFAKVAVVSEMSNIDTITGVQMPFNPAMPNANWEYSNASHGWAKWYYKVANPSNNSLGVEMRDSSAPTNVAAPFYIAGDDKSFALHICPTSDTTIYLSYGFFQFYDAVINSDNQLLLAFGLNSRRTQTSYLLTMARDSLGVNHHEIPSEYYTGDPTPNLKGVLWFNQNGQTNYTLLGKAYHYTQSRTNELYAINSSSAIQDILICDVNGLMRGTVPFIKWQVSFPKTEYVKQVDNSFNLSGVGFTEGILITSRTALSLEAI